MINRNKLCKYILQLLIILLVLKVIPDISMTDKVMISIIIILVFYFFDRKPIEKLDIVENDVKENEKLKKIADELDKLREVSDKVKEDETKITNDKLSVLLDEMGYHDYNHIPIDKDYKSEPFDYGYYYLPPEKWYPTPPFPPVCVTSQPCEVCPVFTTGSPVDVMQWHQSRRITQPDNINVDYVNDKLNSGR